MLVTGLHDKIITGSKKQETENIPAKPPLSSKKVKFGTAHFELIKANIEYNHRTQKNIVNHHCFG